MKLKDFLNVLSTDHDIHVFTKKGYEDCFENKEEIYEKFLDMELKNVESVMDFGKVAINVDLLKIETKEFDESKEGLINKRYFRSQNTGKLYESSDEYWLNICPICEKSLYSNSYSDKEVVENNTQDCVSFDLKIEYCHECDDYYILII